MADKTRLHQILINLLSNATKFTEKRGKIKVGARVNIQENTVEVWVKDNGIGISKNMQKIIFDRFEQIDKSGFKSGVGLGLSISKRLVEMQGGKIWVESTKGKGSTFYFSVPIAG